MANEKRIKSKIIHKHDTAVNWTTAGNNGYVPDKGEFIIYDVDNSVNYERVKVGDGATNINDLPFANGLGQTFGPVEMGNEIFNDYVDNYAGTKAFDILAYEGTHGQPGTYTLDSVEGLAVGDIYSVHVFNTDQSDPTKSSLRLDNGGEITAINGNVVSVSYLYLAYDTVETDVTKEEHSYFRVAAKPDIGTRYVEGLAHVEGRRNKALGYGSHAEGDNNTANGAWAHVEGKSNYANYNSHAEGRNTQSLGETTHTEGGDTIARKSYSHAEGFKSQTDAIAAHAEGEEVIVTGRAAHGEGYKTTSSGAHAHTEGELTQATTNNAHAEGYNSKATASGAHAEGANTQAKAEYSHTEGRNTVTEGQYAHAEGDETKATGFGAHSEGQKTTASAERAHAEGTNTTASGGSAHAEGDGSTASVWAGHAEGRSTKAHTGAGAHAEGFQTEASAQGAHAEGRNTKALKDGSHAEGDNTTANGSYSHAEGYNTTTTGSAAHAEGSGTTASGAQSHAEGNGTTASGSYSHAEGQGTQATNNTAHAEGYNTQAKASGSHAEGGGTIAGSSYQHVEGLYNIEDTENKYIHIAGNGTSSARSNAYTLSKNGEGEFAKSVGIPNFKITKDSLGNFVLQSEYYDELTFSNGITPHATFNKDVTVADTLYVGNSVQIQGKYAATQEYVDNKLAEFVDSAPETLNTLNELADALGNDPNFATTVATEIGKKVDKTTTINGKTLSDNITLTQEDIGVSLESFGITATANELNYTEGVTSNIQEQLDRKVESAKSVNNDTIAYTKNIPEYASTYARINSIGGMTVEKEITFAFRGFEFTVEKGMTWTEFFNYEGNTYESFFDAGGCIGFQGEAPLEINPDTLVEDWLNVNSEVEITYRELIPTKVTAVKSAGANLFDDVTFYPTNGLELQSDGYWLCTSDNNLNFGGEKVIFENSNLTPGSMTLSRDYLIVDDTLSLTPFAFHLFYTDGTSSYVLGQLAREATYITPADKTVDIIKWSYGNRGDFKIKNIMIKWGATALPYTPYREPITMPIPNEVQALEGYGYGVNAQYNNCIKWNEGKITFIQKTIRKVFNGTEKLEDYTSVGSITSPITPYGITGVGNVLDSHGANTVLANTRNIDFKIADYGVSTVEEFRAYLVEQYNAGTPVTVEYVLEEPIVTDVTEYFTDNYIEVEGGGALTMINENKNSVPSSITIYTDNVQILGADIFIGDLTGTAEKAAIAERAEKDGNGNVIADTYAIKEEIPTYSIATASNAGLVKPVSVITKPTINSATTTSGKYYAVQMSNDGTMFVNVPWASGDFDAFTQYEKVIKVENDLIDWGNSGLVGHAILLTPYLDVSSEISIGYKQTFSLAGNKLDGDNGSLALGYMSIQGGNISNIVYNNGLTINNCNIYSKNLLIGNYTTFTDSEIVFDSDSSFIYNGDNPVLSGTFERCRITIIIPSIADSFQNVLSGCIFKNCDITIFAPSVIGFSYSLGSFTISNTKITEVQNNNGTTTYYN